MHPYFGDSNKYPRAIGLPDDGDAAAALTFNVGYEGLSDRTAWTRARVASIAGQNWPFRASVPVQPTAQLIYDTLGERWILAGGPNGTAAQVYSSQEYGLRWFAAPNITGNVDAVTAIGVHPTSGRVVALTQTNKSYYNDGLVAGSTWVAGSAQMGAGARLGRIHYHSPSQLFVAVGHADDNKAHVVTSPDGATWTLRDSGIPAAYATITGWSTAASPAKIIALSNVVNSNGAAMVSSDGITWSQATVPIAKAFAVRVGYGNSEFLAAVFHRRDGDDDSGTSFLASPDGITWTLRGRIAAWTPTDVVSVGSAWVAMGGPVGSSFNLQQVRCSHDFGVTWRMAGVVFNTNGTFRISSNGAQGITTDGTTVVCSQDVGGAA